MFFVFRFLQGWDKAEGWDKADDMPEPVELASFPHSTLFLGLQFTLAGIIGKPVTFFTVPAVRFMFELLSYM